MHRAGVEDGVMYPLEAVEGKMPGRVNIRLPK